MKPYTNPHGETLMPPQVPEEIRLAIYHLHTIGKDGKKAVPAITVALAVHVNGDVVGRGVTVCSPDDYENGCYNRKEGRIRAAARAIRAYKKASNGQMFWHPNALYVLHSIFSRDRYDGYRFFENEPLDVYKYEYLPAPTVEEWAILRRKGLVQT